MNSLLRRLLRRPEAQRTAHLAFTVYSRTACTCCDRAMKVLKDSQRRFGFAIDEVDIDQDPNLVAKYDTEVPVVTVNGKVRFRGLINTALLERLLLAESRQPGSSTASDE